MTLGIFSRWTADLEDEEERARAPAAAAQAGATNPTETRPREQGIRPDPLPGGELGLFSRWTADLARAPAPPAPEPAAAAPEAPRRGAFMRTLLGGILEQLPADIGAGLEAIGGRTGIEGLRTAGRALNDAAGAPSEEYQRRVARFDQIESLSDAATYLGETLGSGLASTAPSIAGAILGGIAGAPLGPAGVAGGALFGAAAPSYVMNTGSLASRLKEAGIPEERADEVATNWAIPIAALDSVSATKLLRAFGMGKAVTDAITDSYAREVVKQAGRGFRREGLTEGAQQGIEEGAVAAETNRDVLSRDTLMAVVDAALQGGIVGGGMQAPAGIGRVAGARRRAAEAETPEEPPPPDQGGMLALPPPSTLYGPEGAFAVPPGPMPPDPNAPAIPPQQQAAAMRARGPAGGYQDLDPYAQSRDQYETEPRPLPPPVTTYGPGGEFAIPPRGPVGPGWAPPPDPAEALRQQAAAARMRRPPGGAFPDDIEGVSRETLREQAGIGQAPRLPPPGYQAPEVRIRPDEERWADAVRALPPGAPVTNSVIANLTGARTAQDAAAIRETWVEQGLIEQRGRTYYRVARDAPGVVPASPGEPAGVAPASSPSNLPGEAAGAATPAGASGPMAFNSPTAEQPGARPVIPPRVTAEGLVEQLTAAGWDPSDPYFIEGLRRLTGAGQISNRLNEAALRRVAETVRTQPEQFRYTPPGDVIERARQMIADRSLEPDPAAVQAAFGLPGEYEARDILETLARSPDGGLRRTPAGGYARQAIGPRAGGVMRGPLNIIEFLISRGGIKDDRGMVDMFDKTGGRRRDAAEIRHILGRDNYVIRFGGKLLRPDGGLDLDYAREAAIEEGYLPADADINDLLALIEDTDRGRARYPMDTDPAETREGKAELEAERDREDRDIREFLIDRGIDPTDMTPKQARQVADELRQEEALAGAPEQQQDEGPEPDPFDMSGLDPDERAEREAIMAIDGAEAAIEPEERDDADFEIPFDDYQRPAEAQQGGAPGEEQGARPPGPEDPEQIPGEAPAGADQRPGESDQGTGSAPAGDGGGEVAPPAGIERLARAIAKELDRGPITTRTLQDLAREEMGVSLADGTIDRKTLYDALELGVNLHIDGNPLYWPERYTGRAITTAQMIEDAVVAALPTQTVRTEEQQQYQQFSTPPHYAYALAHIARIRPGDVVLEPSAGIGGLAIHAKNADATVILNELSDRRREILAVAFPDSEIYGVDAQYLNSALPREVRPTVVLMNPPFSQTAGRMGDKRDLMVGAKHIEQALKRLEPGGRLVSIVGRGMTFDAPTFRPWWQRIGQEYAVRANIGVDGKIYRKYGTEFATRVLVIDKVPPDGKAPVTGEADSIGTLLRALDEVRDDRPAATQSGSDQPGGARPPQGAGGPTDGDRPRPDPGGALPPDQRPRSDGEGGGPGSGGGVRNPDERPGSKEGPGLPLEQPGYPGPGGGAGVAPGEAGGRPGSVGGGGGSAGNAGAGANSKPGAPGPEVRTPVKPPDDYGAKNKLVTNEDAERLRAIIRAKLRGTQLNTGIDPELFSAGAQMAVYHLEAGARKFADYVARMVDDFGGAIRPYLRGWYENARYYPGFDATGMSTPAEIEAYERGENATKPEPEPKPEPAPPAGSGRPRGGRGGRGGSGGGKASGNNAPAPRPEPAPEDDGDVPPLEVRDAPYLPAQGAMNDVLYEEYKPQRLAIQGAKPHPGPLVESAAMATVRPPAPTYRPRIQSALVNRGTPSLAQLEPVVAAGQAHAEMLPAAEGQTAFRRGYFIGDGTGVGKGMIAASIVLDNKNHGRKKAVWISEKPGLLADAMRDWKHLEQPVSAFIPIMTKAPTGAPKGIARGQKIEADSGIAYLTYSTLAQDLYKNQKDSRRPSRPAGAAEAPKKDEKQTRFDQLLEWLGPDFDGVIIFDEAHAMKNATDTRGARGIIPAADAAKAGILLQDRLPNARIVYMSATAATDVKNLSYARRLGLWGYGTSFADQKDFIEQMEMGGVSAMELIARDLKSMGLYTARSLSYDGVEYDKLEHGITDSQRANYDELAGIWRQTLADMYAALDTATDGSRNQRNVRGQISSQFWNAHQRFFNELVTSMQMPSVFAAIDKDLAEGRQVVVQLTSTNEANAKRARDSVSEDGDYEDIDLSPREQLVALINRTYPVNQMTEIEDENGNVVLRPVVGPDGNPVRNPELEARRDALLERVARLRVPDGAMDQIIEKYGSTAVAEVTGRSRRFVRDRDGRRIDEPRPAAAREQDANDFQDGKRRILVFSEAGGTGRSFHAAKGSKAASRRRVHYLLQAGWRADKAVQGFGRSHRTNQESAPIFRLVSTDIKGQRRFISSIARRLGQLGALTKGQRQAGEQGMFGLKDNLETPLAESAMRNAIRAVDAGQVPGLGIMDFMQQTGLNLLDPETHQIKTNLPGMSQVLNRLLSMEIDAQNRFFERFEVEHDRAIEAARDAGTLDLGLQTIEADKIEKIADDVLHTHADGGDVRMKTLKIAVRNTPLAFETVARRQPDLWVKGQKNVYAAFKTATRTAENGDVLKMWRLVPPLGDSTLIEDTKIQNDKYWTKLPNDDAKLEWRKAVDALPEFREYTEHLITGTLLPVWDRLRNTGSTLVWRTQTDAGEKILGRWIEADAVPDVLRNFGLASGQEQAQAPSDPAEIAAEILKGATATLANGWGIRKRIVAMEDRIEVEGVDWNQADALKREGVFEEIILNKSRYFVPLDRAAAVLRQITFRRPIVTWTPARKTSGRSSGGRMSRATGMFSRDDRPRAPDFPPADEIEQISGNAGIWNDPSTAQANIRYEAQIKLQALARRLTGKSGARIVVADRVMEIDGDTRQPIVDVFGTAAPGDDGLIYVALRDIPHMAGTTRHETIHFLRQVGAVTASQWAALQRRALAWRKQFEIDKYYGGASEEVMNEEAVAHAYEAWARGELRAPTAIERIFQLIADLRAALRAIMEMNGFAEAYRIAAGPEAFFRAIERGRFSDRRDVGPRFTEGDDALMHTAYHGSPHDHDRFSTQHIGTGEGGQAYGWGLYFAGKREVAEHYRKNLARDPYVLLDGKPATRADSPDAVWIEGEPQYVSHAIAAAAYNGSVPAAISALEKYVSGRPSLDNRRHVEQQIEWLKSNAGRLTFPTRGRLYQVDLAPKEDEYLDWDKPLSEQSEKVKAALRKVASPKARLFTTEPERTFRPILRAMLDGTRDQERDGGSLYYSLSRRLGSDRAASQALHAAGIPGIRYLDQFSRTLKDEIIGNTHNYVIFDDSLVKIEAKFARDPEARYRMPRQPQTAPDARRDTLFGDVDRTAQGEQPVMPGMERISDRVLVERRMRGAMQAPAAQASVGGTPLFGGQPTPKAAQVSLFEGGGKGVEAAGRLEVEGALPADETGPQFPDAAHRALYDMGARLNRGEAVRNAEVAQALRVWQGFMISEENAPPPTNIATMRQAAMEYAASVDENGSTAEDMAVEPDRQGEWYRSGRGGPLPTLPDPGPAEVDMARDLTESQLKARLRQRGLSDLPLFDQNIPKQSSLFSRIRTPMTAAQEQKFGTVFAKTERSLGERVTELWRNLNTDIGLKLRQGLVDDLAAGEEREIRAGVSDSAVVNATKMARLTRNLDSVMATVLGIQQASGGYKGGALWYNAAEGVFQTNPNSTARPFLEIFAPIFKRGLQDQWAAWAVAHRAKRLKAEGRENLVSDDFIREFENIDRQYIENGRNAFREAMTEWTKLNKATLDMAEATGLVNAEQRQLFERADYVPFYRVLEDEVIGPRNKQGIASQGSGIRRLMGGEEQLGDIYENMVHNLTKLVDASMKNEAMRRYVANLDGTDAFEAVPLDWKAAHVSAGSAATALRKIGVDVDKMDKQQRESWLKLFTMTAPKDPEVVHVMIDGKPQYYRVNDPMLLRSLTAISPGQMDGVTRVMGAAKRLVTGLITADPAFMAANVMRDTIHTWVVTGSKFTPGVDTVRGAIKAAKNDPAAMAIMAGGAGGGYFYDTNPRNIRRALASRDFAGTVLNSPRKIWDALQYMGRISEMANRIAVYDAAIRAGKPKADAIAEAQDVLNFTRRGDFAAIRFLTEVVPFLNARLQGLDRLRRGAADNPKRFLLRGLPLMGAALALWAVNADDERWKALEDWDKNAYFHFFVGGMHFRLPKPFEVGALFATLPEMMADYSQDGREKVIWRRLAQTFLDTFAFNPTPQLIKPVVDLYANRDSFTGRPIVSQAADRLKPEAQFGPHTGATSVAIGGLAGVSPEQIEFAVRGYLGTLGTYALGLSDLAAEQFREGSRPSRRIDQMPVVKRFVRDEPALGTKWINEFYDLKKDVDEIYATVKEYEKRGDIARARELAMDNQAKLAFRQQLTKTANVLSQIRRDQRAIEYDRTMAPEVKRERIDRLIAMRNRMAEQVRPMLGRLEGSTP